jgi:hypothetical protein
MDRRHLLKIVTTVGVSTTATLATAADTQKYPDVLSARVRTSGSDVFDFDVTVSSPYDSPTRYADAFRARDKTGTVFGERILLHDHASEQPFTRDMYTVKIPASVKTVILEARDKAFGYGGKIVEVKLPGR